MIPTISLERAHRNQLEMPEATPVTARARRISTANLVNRRSKYLAISREPAPQRLIITARAEVWAPVKVSFGLEADGLQPGGRDF